MAGLVPVPIVNTTDLASVRAYERYGRWRMSTKATADW